MKEALNKPSRPWSITVSILATLLVPLVLVFLGVRLLASDLFLNVEYNLPHFPVDSYGFTLSERLEYASLCVEYLNTAAGPELLSDQTFPDGSPLFNGREISHMQDVQEVFIPIINLGFGLTLALFGLLLLAQRRPWKLTLLAGMRRGGWLTFGLVTGLSVFALLGFATFFESFHAIFFEGDSWRFLYSDTLIRLFPMQFWQDAVLFLLVFTAGLGLLLGLLLRQKGKPKGT